jgi:hypothetical protein
MAIASTDIKYRLSGGAANANPATSLGGALSTTDTPVGFFNQVSSTEAQTGSVKYRCEYVKNENGTLTLTGAHVWVPVDTVSADTKIDIGLGTSAIGGTEQTIANESTAPSGVTFVPATTEGAALTIGDLAPGATKAIWLRRTVNAGAASSNDTYTLRVKGDTLP